MNVAELTAVLVAICGFATPGLFALSRGAPWWGIILCGVAGALYGVGLGLAAGRTAFWLLGAGGKNRAAGVLAFVAYMLFPLPAIGISIVGALVLTSFFVK